MKSRFATAVGLSLCFMLVYGACNTITSHRENVGTIYFEWEHWIPFIPWMVIPYLSIDLLFFAAPFIIRNEIDLVLYRKRILAVIFIAGFCFLMFPLKLAVGRKPLEGFLGFLWNPFLKMDQPHNLMPSLHIGLRTILAFVYSRNLQGNWKNAIGFWFSLIGFSTLLTHQHHIIDVFTGFVLGFTVLHWIPSQGFRVRDEKNIFMAIFSATIALACGSVLYSNWPNSFLMLWPTVAFLLQALIYCGITGIAYDKFNGRLAWHTRLLFLPMIVGQWLSWRYYRLKSTPWSELLPQIWIGRLLNHAEAELALSAGVSAVLDLTSEFSENPVLMSKPYLNIPTRDLTALNRAEIQLALDFIQLHETNGIVYIHCKAGFSRSVIVAAAYLLKSNRASNVSEALRLIQKNRPEVVFRPEVYIALEDYQRFQNPEMIQNQIQK